MSFEIDMSLKAVKADPDGPISAKKGRERPEAPEATPKKAIKLEPQPIKADPDATTMTIFTKDMFGKTRSYVCTRDTTVKELCSQIFDKTKTTNRVMFKAKFLDEESTLRANGIQDRDVMHLFAIKCYNDLERIELVTLTGRRHEYPANAKTTVGDLKQLVLRDTGSPLGEQRLIFAGIQLEGDSTTLNSYGGGKSIKVFMVQLLKGGMFHASSSRNDMKELVD